MEAGSSKSVHLTTSALYFVSLAIFVSLHFIAPEVSRPFSVSEKSAFADWTLVASTIAFFWAIWTSMTFQRARMTLGPWRLLRLNFVPLSVAFAVSSACAVWAAVTMNLELPADSPLMDSRNVSVVIAYCRLPILGQIVAGYVMSASIVYLAVKSRSDVRKMLVYCGLTVLVYYFLLVLISDMFRREIEDMVMFPNKTHYLALLLFWIPSVVASLTAMIAYNAAFKRK